MLGWPAFGGSKRNHDEGVHAFSGQDFLVYGSHCPPRRVFSHVGPQKPLVFTWFRDFHAFLRPPVAPRGLEIKRKCSSKTLVKRSFETAAGQKRIRTMARWPGFGGACPTGDPATEPRRGRAWPSRSVLVWVWTLKKCPKRTQRYI